MPESEKEYLESRAEAQLELARQAEHRDVAQAHYEMACAYLDRIYPTEQLAGPTEVSERALPGDPD